MREGLQHRGAEEHEHDQRRDEAPGVRPVGANLLARHVLEVATEVLVAVDVDHRDDFEERNAHQCISAGEVIEQRYPVLNRLVCLSRN